jgi:acetyltransferase
VAVGVEDARSVEMQFAVIRENLRCYKEDACFDGVRLQQMAPEGYDMFVGGKYDEAFGPVVFLGMGGIYVELFRDVANTLCPASSAEIRKQLERLKAFSVLEGMRGKERGDIDAFVDLVVRVSHLLEAFPEIRELDVNPVRVFGEGRGVMALDARLRVQR